MEKLSKIFPYSPFPIDIKAKYGSIKAMKKDIHPKYYQAKVTCACGNTFTVGSTMPEIKVEVCAKCHSFFTGQEKLVDTAGRVERFKKMVAKQAQLNKKK